MTEIVAPTQSAPASGQSAQVSGQSAPASTQSVPASQPKAKKALARILSLLIIIGAIALGVYLLAGGEMYPRTDDAYVQARYITVSAEVPGRIAELDVADGQAVEPGQRMLLIDPQSYRLAVEESVAQIAALEAQIAEAGRQRQAALELVQMAHENVARMEAKELLAQSTYERMSPLAEQGYVTQERYDGVFTEYENARSAVLMARSNALAAELSVPSLDALQAELKAAQVRLAQAQLELQRTEVKASFGGRIVNCDLAPGMMVSPGQPLFTLIDTGEWFVVANYREGDLKNIALGAAARVRLLTLPERTFSGTVVSIGHGVQTQDGYNFGSLPTVRNQLNWVRTAQRFPVRIRIDEPEPQAPFRIGASAVVTIEKR